MKSITAQGSLIIIVARDEGQNRYTIQCTGFRPYFYVEQNEENARTLTKRGLEHEEGLPTLFGTPTWKVYVDSPASVPKRRKGFTGAKESYEADVPYPRRFLVDTGIHDGFEIDGEYQTIGATIVTDWRNLKPVSFRTPDRLFCYDIETNKPEGSKHYSPPIIAAGAVTAKTFHDSYDEGHFHTYYWHPERGVPGRPQTEQRTHWSDTFQRHVPWTVVTYGTEEEMHIGIVQYLKKNRPDSMEAWNGHHGHHRKNKGGFDAPYMINRLPRLKLSPAELSPLGNAYAGYKMFGKDAKKSSKASKGKWMCVIDGVQLIDAMTTYQIKEGGFTAQVPFSDLKRVSEKFIKKKLKKDPSSITEWWLNNTEQFLDYSFNDVDALVGLEMSEGYSAFARDMQQFVGCEDASKLFTPMALIDSVLLRIARKRGVCVPSSQSEEDSDYTAEGGFVLDPRVKGLQRRVGVLDLTTMYVHIIISGNLSPETHVPNPTEEQMDDLICVPSDLGPQFFLKPSVQTGLIPEVCQFFRAVRKKYDDLIDAATSAEEVKKLKHQRQPAKQLLLGVWGTSLSEFFRLFKPEVGSSITGTGRFIIQSTDEFVESQGLRVVYQDTDSAFIPLPGQGFGDEATIEAGEGLAAKINGNFDRLAKGMNMDVHGFEIGLETVYDPFVMGDTKKMYAGNIVWSEGKWQVDKEGNPSPVFSVAGVPGIKSDAAPITRDITEALLKAILSHAQPLELIEYVRTTYDGVMSGEVPISDIIKAVTLNLDPDDPDPEIQSNYIVKAVKHGRTMYEFDYAVGAKVRVVSLKGEDDWIAIPDEEELPKDLRLDLEHHADLTVLNPAQSILDWVGLELATVKHGTVTTAQRRL